MAIKRHRVEMDRLEAAEDEQRRLMEAKRREEEYRQRMEELAEAEAAAAEAEAVTPEVEVALSPAVAKLAMPATPQGERRPSRFEVRDY